jgi:hypothetical protein
MASAKIHTSIETSTYGIEFSAARTAVEYIVGMSLLLRSLAYQSMDPSVLSGDKYGVVLSANQFTSYSPSNTVRLAITRCVSISPPKSLIFIGLQE